MTSRLSLLSAVAIISVLVVAISGCSTSSTSPSSAADPGEVFGYVLNALTAGPIEGATVTVDGEATVTDSLGYYIVEDVDPGNVTVEASVTDFVTVSTGVEIEEGESVRQDCVLIPSTTGGEYRIVLTWGENPSDLDSHLWVPVGDGSDYHVYYSYRGSVTSSPYAELDVDDVNGYGPETMTVLPEYSGQYTYAVYHYAGTGTFLSSEATLRIYQGNVLRHTLTVPDQTCEDRWWWNVCTFDAESGEFTIVNTLQTAAPVLTGRMVK